MERIPVISVIPVDDPDWQTNRKNQNNQNATGGPEGSETLKESSPLEDAINPERTCGATLSQVIEREKELLRFSLEECINV